MPCSDSLLDIRTGSSIRKDVPKVQRRHQSVISSQAFDFKTEPTSLIFLGYHFFPSLSQGTSFNQLKNELTRAPGISLTSYMQSVFVTRGRRQCDIQGWPWGTQKGKKGEKDEQLSSLEENLLTTAIPSKNN